MSYEILSVHPMERRGFAAAVGRDGRLIAYLHDFGAGDPALTWLDRGDGLQLRHSPVDGRLADMTPEQWAFEKHCAEQPMYSWNWRHYRPTPVMVVCDMVHEWVFDQPMEASDAPRKEARQPMLKVIQGGA